MAKTEPVRGQSNNSPSYVITFRDPGTGKTLTDRFPVNMSLIEIRSRLEAEGILSFPAEYLVFPGVLRRYGSVVADLPDLHSGMTVTYCAQPAQSYPHTDAARLYKSYPLNFQILPEGIFPNQVSFLCYGFETADDVIRRMLAQEVIDSYFEYRMLYWPDRGGYIPTPESPCSYKPSLPLFRFNPRPGTVLALQEEYPRRNSDRDLMLPLYGCPRADLPLQASALQEGTVDILKFE